MTAARRTPRYVPIIGQEPLGPQLMGPHPAPAPHQPAPAYTPHAGSSRRNSSGVLELHPDRQALHFPSAPPVPVAPAAPSPRRAPGVPLARRPWEVVILSAAPDVAPRHLRVARWQVRLALAALGVVAVLVVGAVTAVAVAVRDPELFSDRGDIEQLQAELTATQDSLEAMRVEGFSGDASAEGPATDSALALAARTVIARPALAPKRTAVAPLRPRPLRTRSERSAGGEGDASSVEMPSMIADLPVIGALASRFSLARRHPILRRVRPHLGVDVAAPRGTRVSAPAPGRVKFVGRKIGFGLVVELDHGEGIVTRYAHLRSAAVQVGEQVTKGEAIAAVGTSGLSTGPHLHYEVLVNGRQVDPLRFRFSGSDAAPPTSAAPVPAPAPAVVPPSPVQATGGGAMMQEAGSTMQTQQMPR